MRLENISIDIDEGMLSAADWKEMISAACKHLYVEEIHSALDLNEEKMKELVKLCSGEEEDEEEEDEEEE